MTRKILFVTSLLVTFYYRALAQQLPDSTAYKTALSVYIGLAGEQSELYKGTEYIGVRSNKGSVFFKDNSSWTMATVVYEGNVYNNVPVLYDSFNDLLVGRYYDNVTRYILRPDRTTGFQLGTHHFLRLQHQNIKNAVKDSFYEQLYNGKSQVIAKRGKERTETMSQQEGVQVIFGDKSEIYIKKGNLFYSVQSRGDVLKLFKDKADALNRFIKTGTVDFRRDQEEAIVELAKHYDQLPL
jgi:hypothetical protein